MKARTHRNLMNTFTIFAFLVPFILVCSAIIRGGPQPGLGSFFFGWIVGISIVGLILIYLVPVRCDKPGCKEKARPGWELSGDGIRLIYRCDACSIVYESSFTLGGGEPWR